MFVQETLKTENIIKLFSLFPIQDFEDKQLHQDNMTFCRSKNTMKTGIENVFSDQSVLIFLVIHLLANASIIGNHSKSKVFLFKYRLIF